MGDVAKHGRTVLFVSHNLPAVKALCTRSLLLEHGKLALDGNVDHVVDSYLRAGSDERSKTGIIPDSAPRLWGTDEAKLRLVRLTNLSGDEVSQLYLGQPCRLELTFEVFKEIKEAVIEVGIVALDGTHVTNSSNIDGGKPPFRLGPGKHVISLELHTVLMPRQYTFLVGLSHFNGLTVEWIDNSLEFSVQRVAETGSDNYRWSSVRGYVRPETRWLAVEAGSVSSEVNTLENLAGGHVSVNPNR